MGFDPQLNQLSVHSKLMEKVVYFSYTYTYTYTYTYLPQTPRMDFYSLPLERRSKLTVAEIVRKQ